MIKAAALRIVGAIALTLLSVAIAAPAFAQRGARNLAAEQFVQTEAQRALDILARHQDRADQKRLFRSFVDEVADVPRITYFVLGKYARTITPSQSRAFSAVFREFASNVYESRLSDYHGETLRVTGSVSRTPTDVVVTSVITGGHLDEPVTVDWRVLGEAGGWKVVDVEIKGVWLAITEQQDFVSTIDNAGGDIDVLIDQLQRDVKTADASG